MGLSLSCPVDEFGVFDENLEALIVSSIGFKDENANRTLRSVSFNGREAEPTLVKSFGSGKMIIEGSLSFKGRETDPMHLETAISVKAPALRAECARLTGITDEASSPCSRCSNSPVERISFDPNAASGNPKYKAAVQLQKVYKSFRTRRKLADCAVLVEQRWWKLLDFAVLKRSSVSFFDIGKQETAISRWSRARTRAAKVGKGLSKDKKAQKLALQHWLEAIDPRHRYGHNLNFYYDSWLNCDSRQPFFYWLDVGEGRDYNLDECPRSKLQQQCIKYLGPKERETYEVIVENGKFLYNQSRQFLDTSEAAKETKFIFVLSTSKKLYVGQKKKGTFQHSSFLAGGATSAAGRLEVEKGVLKAVWPHSGHYQPTEENFQEFISFLKENDVNLTDVKNSPIDEEEASLIEQRSCQNSLRRDSTELDLATKATQFAQNESITEREKLLKPSNIHRRKDVTISIPDNTHLLDRLKNEARDKDKPSPSRSSMVSPLSPNRLVERPSTSEGCMSPKWNLFEEDQEDNQEVVPEESILRRIMSKKGMKSYQLGRQLSCKWTTGAGPRIGCVRDYPTELQSQALEKLNLSPRSSAASKTCSSPHKSLPGYSDSYSSPRHITSGTGSSRAYSSPRCLNCPSKLSLSKERSNSFHNSYSIQC